MQLRSLAKISNELCGIAAILNRLYRDDLPEDIARMLTSMEEQQNRIADEVAEWSVEWDGLTQQNKRIRKELDDLKQERKNA